MWSTQKCVSRVDAEMTIIKLQTDKKEKIQVSLHGTIDRTPTRTSSHRKINSSSQGIPPVVVVAGLTSNC